MQSYSLSLPRCAQKGDDPSKGPDYLRAEYLSRLYTGPLQYRLQIQTRPWPVLTTPPNPSLKWSPSKHPWQELAVITIALPLPQATICRTKICLQNYPKGVFSLPDPSDKHDFLSLGHAMSELHSIYQKSEGDLEIKRTYVITVVTGRGTDAGTDADVHITITGESQ